MSETMQLLKQLDTSTISDALDKLEINGQCFGIQSKNHTHKIVGRAFTVQYIKQENESGTVGDYIDDVEPGEVIVLANEGRMDCTVWGDILTSVAKRTNIAGTVIDGVNRDSSQSLALDYPIFSKGAYMRTGKGRVQVQQINEPVYISDVKVCPGDIIVGDSDGVVVIPVEKEAEVVAAALEIKKNEDLIRQSIEKGMRLDEARTRYNYHELQNKGDLSND
ncbi:RraA family protein [Alkalicoccobacillus murimartini]|uniref:Putative 4-hydroxy-4-methyl-2-oxoglutarate aldolase n=1 Tax=Alkalicoccobacillus murimartini TaxID=171685 RepID=A0ABT9YE65_9BACI|nr:RraA family protein [Alkalicoccobacillus murimartini]MDQ0206140.1 regulator of RNase E activity RraA [Alkalicoccobacillus murimartini]